MIKFHIKSKWCICFNTCYLFVFFLLLFFSIIIHVNIISFPFLSMIAISVQVIKICASLIQIEQASRFRSHASCVIRCTDRFVCLGRVVFLRWSRPPDVGTGKPASISRGLRLALLEPRWRRVSRVSKVSGGVKFIVWCLRRSFLRGIPTGPEAFLEQPGVAALWPCARTHLKKARGSSPQFGGVHDKNTVSSCTEVKCFFKKSTFSTKAFSFDDDLRSKRVENNKKNT